jgi:hypothetical protein
MTGLNLMTLLRPEDLEYITSNKFLKNVKSSKILKCVVIKNDKEIISEKQKYASIMQDIWRTMPSDEIVYNTQLTIVDVTNNNKNIDITKKTPKGKNHYQMIKSNPNLYFRNKSARPTMEEILYLCKIKNYTIKITIKKNDKVFSYKQ